MSFAPPSPAGSPGGPDRPHGSPLDPPAHPGTGHPGPPRSTPIPGFESPLPGNTGAAPPPRPTEFVSGAAAPAPMAYQAMTDSAPPPIKQSRSWGSMIFVIILFAGPIIGIGVGAWAFLKGRDTADKADQAIDDANQTVDSLLQQVQDELDGISVPVVTLPGIPTIDSVPAVTLPTAPPQTVAPETAPPVTAAPLVSNFADGGAPGLMASYDAAISGEPSRMMQVVIYPDYAFATAQDANAPTHVDEYPWRDGVVGPSSPVTLTGSGDLESNLWNVTDVDWTFLARAVAEAPGLTTVEEGAVSHIIIERSVFTADFSVVVRVYVTGPRGGGYVEYTPTGVLIQVVQ